MKRTSAAWPTWVDKIYFGDVTKTTNVSRVRDTKRTTTDASSSRVPESCKPPARVWRGQVRSCVVHAHALARGLDLRVDACVRGRRRDSRNRRYFSHAGRTVACRPGAPRRLPSRDTRDEATSFVIYDPSRAREAHPGRVYPLRRPRLPRDARPRPPRPRPGKPPVPDRRRDRRRRTLPRPETLTIAGVPVTTFAAGAGVALLAALGSGIGFMRTPAGKSLAEDYADKLNLVQRRAAMKLEAEAVDAFGRGGAQFPIINRYAERVLAEYDSAAIPDMFEVFVYETIIRTAALGAFLSAYVNVKGSDVLGHPVQLRNEIEWGHEPPFLR